MTMKPHFDKLLVERPRPGSRHLRNGSAVKLRHTPVGDEDSVSGLRSGMNPRTGDQKYFNENLNPLKRWLQKQVGRPWDKVYAEIVERNSKASTVGAHVYQHLFQYVEVHTRFTPEGPRREDGSQVYRGLVYVDPRTGILRRPGKKDLAPTYGERMRQERSKTDPRVVRVSEFLYHVQRKDGVWFGFEYVPDVVTAQVLNRGLQNEYTYQSHSSSTEKIPQGFVKTPSGPKGYYVGRVWTLAKRELRRAA